MYNVSHFKQIFDRGLKDWKTKVLIRWKRNCPLAISIPESRVNNNYDTKLRLLELSEYISVMGQSNSVQDLSW